MNLVLPLMVVCFSVAAAGAWPSFSTMWTNYPCYEGSTRCATTYNSKTELQKLAGLPRWLYNENTCAMRVSYALIQSGHSIGVTTSGYSKWPCNWSGVKGNGNKYIIRVLVYVCYLQRNKKNVPDVTGSVESTFSGKKGIIVFQKCNFQTATGHVDLWNGSECAGKCYFDRCNKIKLWKFD